MTKRYRFGSFWGFFFLSVFFYGFPEHPRRVRVVVASLPRPPDVPARRYACADASPACPARPKPLTNPVRDPYPAWSAGAPTPKNLEKYEKSRKIFKNHETRFSYIRLDFCFTLSGDTPRHSPAPSDVPRRP